MLGGDVFEDAQRLVVRLEVPGMEKEDLEIEFQDDALVISGENASRRRAARAAGASCSAPMAISAGWCPCLWR
jgi:HSP20 family molecular chaperone IbpA